MLKCSEWFLEKINSFIQEVILSLSNSIFILLLPWINFLNNKLKEQNKIKYIKFQWGVHIFPRIRKEKYSNTIKSTQSEIFTTQFQWFIDLCSIMLPNKDQLFSLPYPSGKPFFVLLSVLFLLYRTFFADVRFCFWWCLNKGILL